MRNLRQSKRGQFSVIAALLVSVILIMAVISMYSMVRYIPLNDSPQVLTDIGEMNNDIKRILDFTVGYYGSVVKVTGNYEYAQSMTTNYLSSGLVNIARSHPEWNPSFELDFEEISSRWFMPYSYSKGSINVTYSLSALGIEGITYHTSTALSINMLNSSNPNYALINVTRDNSEPELGLTKENFSFYKYNDESTWELVNPDTIVIKDELYNITIPNGVNQDAYSVQVEDDRGIVVPAFYSAGSITTEFPHFTYTFNWEPAGIAGISDIYDSLDTDTFVIELLQNGTLKWLGQPLELSSTEQPIPPVCVKAFHVNATIDGTNQEVPFQVEDWASNYMVPLGLSSEDSIFSDTNMLVFLVNSNVDTVTVWWDGNDTATQTPYAQQNNFSGDVSDTYHISLSNGKIDINVNIDAANLVVTSTNGFTSNHAEFLRINGESPVFHAGTSCVIYNGSVRAILQQEPEYSSGATDMYSQLILTLPANTTYYTYTSRLIFVETTQPRSIDDLSVIQLSGLSGNPLTEDGISEDYPNPYAFAGSFSDGSPSGWDHHWSQFSNFGSGSGVMFTDSANENLYFFDNYPDTGALVVGAGSSKFIEVNPVELNSVPFDYSNDITWYGAVVNFNGEPIYQSSGNFGLWVMVEYPPSVSLD